ncbi:MAG: histidinol dehydrogenase [Gammaproteobacteria bacterium]|nr:histidinol dehydrogenase [Gammaproteobacteria bacterium]NNL46269.1 histidinol dehydrogenase [Woeseiaceae bacterium]
MTLELKTWSELGDAQRSDLLQRPAVAGNAAIRKAAAEIVAQVRKRGDSALRELTQKYDRARISDFRVTADEIAVAAEQLTQGQVDAIDLAIRNVRRFHEQQRPQQLRVETMPGVVCERVSHALDAVGMYVPAGTAPLPSAAIMLAVPAAIAGCPTKILCTPPRPDGSADPAVLVAATRAGVEDIYKIGGAQAIAAMAYGTESVPKVCKVFGPGNAWVTSAKSLVSGDPGGAAIDMPAGPSEVLVIADADASAEFVAADLLSQAEHGVDSQVVLVTTSRELANKVVAQLDLQLAELSRARIARESLEHARIFIVADIGTAVSVSNRYAPEHLILQVGDARALLPSLRNAGSVFVGRWTPEAVGDYCSGTNHVLPTYGFARTYSGLGLDQFMRQMTVQELSREGLAGLGDAVVSLASMEGLDAHAEAVRRRLSSTS